MNGIDPRKQAIIDKIDRLNRASYEAKIARYNKQIKKEASEEMLQKSIEQPFGINYFVGEGDILTPEQEALSKNEGFKEIVKKQSETGLNKDISLLKYKEPTPIDPNLPKKTDIFGFEKSNPEVETYELLRLLGIEDKPIGEIAGNVVHPLAKGLYEIDEGLQRIAKGDIIKGGAYTVVGGLKTFFNSLPAVAGLNSMLPAFQTFGREIDKTLGGTGEKGEEVVNKLAPFMFGKWIGAGSILAEEVDKLGEQQQVFQKLFPDPEEQYLARELLSNAILVGLAIGGKKIDQKYIDPFLDRTFPKARKSKTYETAEKIKVNIYPDTPQKSIKMLKSGGDTKLLKEGKPREYPPIEGEPIPPEKPAKLLPEGKVKPTETKPVKPEIKPTEVKPVEQKSSKEELKELNKKIESLEEYVSGSKTSEIYDPRDIEHINQTKKEIEFLKRKRDALYKNDFKSAEEIDNALEYFKGRKNYRLSDYEKGRKNYLIKLRKKVKPTEIKPVETEVRPTETKPVEPKVKPTEIKFVDKKSAREELKKTNKEIEELKKDISYMEASDDFEITATLRRAREELKNLRIKRGELKRLLKSKTLPEVKPTEIKPVETEVKPTEVKLVESKVGNHPSEKPTETKPIEPETKPTEIKPVEQKSAEVKTKTTEAKINLPVEEKFIASKLDELNKEIERTEKFISESEALKDYDPRSGEPIKRAKKELEYLKRKRDALYKNDFKSAEEIDNALEYFKGIKNDRLSDYEKGRKNYLINQRKKFADKGEIAKEQPKIKTEEQPKTKTSDIVKKEPEAKPQEQAKEQPAKSKGKIYIPKIPAIQDEASLKEKIRKIQEERKKLNLEADRVNPEVYKTNVRLVNKLSKLEDRYRALYQEEFEDKDDIKMAARYIAQEYGLENLPPDIQRRLNRLKEEYDKIVKPEIEKRKELEKQEREEVEKSLAEHQREKKELNERLLNEIPELDRYIFEDDLPKHIAKNLADKLKGTIYHSTLKSDNKNAKSYRSTLRDYVYENYKSKNSLFEDYPNDYTLNRYARAIDFIVDTAKKHNLNTSQYVGKVINYVNREPKLLEHTKGKFKTVDAFREYLLKTSKEKPKAETKPEETKPVAKVEAKTKPEETSGKVSTKQKIVDTPIKNIKEDVQKFQGRDENYSMNSFIAIVGGKVKQALEDGEINEQQAREILEDANKYHKETNRRDPELTLENLPPKRFYWNEFGQVALWRNKAGELYVLSGHSRFNSSKFLSKYFTEFEEIPTVIYEEAKGITFDEAQKLALESNYLQTKQSLGSNIKYLQQLRQNGVDEKKIKQAAKQFFGKEGSDIYTYSFLNPNGYTYQALTSSETDNTMRDLAKWIGRLRETNEVITDAHENELFDFLFHEGNYKTRFRNLTQFIEFVERKTQNKFFDATQPLNLKNVTINPAEKYFASELSELKDKLRKSNEELQKKAQAYKSKNLPDEEINKRLQPILEMINRYTVEIAELEAKAKEFDQTQTSLFEPKAEYKLSKPESLELQDQIAKYQAREKRELTKWEKYVINKNWVQGGSLNKFLDKAWKELQSDENLNKYILTEDSEAITKIIEEEIAQGEELGIDVSNLKANINNPQVRQRVIEEYQKTQREEIQRWFDYLNNQSDYELAFKYALMKNILAYNYDLNKNNLTQRNNKTIKNFTPVNQAAIGIIHSEFNDSNQRLIVAYVKELARQVELEAKYHTTVKETKDGRWIKFNSYEHDPDNFDENASQLATLVQNTIWCTKTNARSQLRHGDFYVYVTKDNQGKEYPRIAVRMDGDSVGEVRGILSGQTIENEMLDEAYNFIRTLKGGEKWIENIEFNKKVKYYNNALTNRTLNETEVDDLLYTILNPVILEYENVHYKNLQKKLKQVKIQNYLKKLNKRPILFLEEAPHLGTDIYNELTEKTDLVILETTELTLDHPNINLVNSVSAPNLNLSATNNKPVTIKINTNYLTIEYPSYNRDPKSQNKNPITLVNSIFNTLNVYNATVINEIQNEPLRIAKPKKINLYNSIYKDNTTDKLSTLDVSSSNATLEKLTDVAELYIKDNSVLNVNKLKFAEVLSLHGNSEININNFNYNKIKELYIFYEIGDFAKKILNNIRNSKNLRRIDLDYIKCNILDIKDVDLERLHIGDSNITKLSLSGITKNLLIDNLNIVDFENNLLIKDYFHIRALNTDNLNITTELKNTNSLSIIFNSNIDKINIININKDWQQLKSSINIEHTKSKELYLKNISPLFFDANIDRITIDGDNKINEVTINKYNNINLFKSVDINTLYLIGSVEGKVILQSIIPNQDKIFVNNFHIEKYNKNIADGIDAKNILLKTSYDTPENITLPKSTENFSIYIYEDNKKNLYIDNANSKLKKFTISSDRYNFKFKFPLFKNKIEVDEFDIKSFSNGNIQASLETIEYKQTNLKINNLNDKHWLTTQLFETIRPSLGDNIKSLKLFNMPDRLSAKSIDNLEIQYSLDNKPKELDIEYGNISLGFYGYANLSKPLKITERVKKIVIKEKLGKVYESEKYGYDIPDSKQLKVIASNQEERIIEITDKKLYEKELEVKENAAKYVPVDEKSTKVMKWFGDSKIKDQENNPIVTYSAQNNKLIKFDPEKSDLFNFFGRAYYSTTNIADAEAYKGKTVEKLGKADSLVNEIKDFIDKGKADNPEELSKLYRKIDHLLNEDIRNIISLLNFYKKSGKDSRHLLNELKLELLNQMSNDSVIETYLKINNPLIVNPVYKKQNIPYENKNNWNETFINLEDLAKISSLKPTTNDPDLTSDLLWKELEFNNKTRFDVINELTEKIRQAYGQDSVPASVVIREMIDYLDPLMPNYSREFIKSAIATLGYDGVVMLNANENFMFSNSPTEHIIAFYPNQIKSTRAENFGDDNLIYNDTVVPYSLSRNRAEEDAFYNTFNTHPYFRNLAFKISNKTSNNIFGEVNADFDSANHIEDLYINLSSKRPFIANLYFELNKDRLDFTEFESLISKLPLQESKNIDFVKEIIKDLTPEKLNSEFAELLPYFNKPAELDKKYVYDLFDNYIYRFAKNKMPDSSKFYLNFRDSFVNTLYDYIATTPIGTTQKFDEGIFTLFNIKTTDVIDNITTDVPIIAVSPENIYVIDKKDTTIARLRKSDSVQGDVLTKAINRLTRTKSDVVAMHVLKKDNLINAIINNGKLLAPSIALVKRSHSNSITGLMATFSGATDDSIVLIGNAKTLTDPSVVMKSRDFYSGSIEATTLYQMNKNELVDFISKVIKKLAPEVYALPKIKDRIIELADTHLVRMDKDTYEINNLSYRKILDQLLNRKFRDTELLDFYNVNSAIYNLNAKVEAIAYETDEYIFTAQQLIDKIAYDKEKSYSSGKLLGMLADTFNGLDDVTKNKNRLGNRIFIDNTKYEELMQALEKASPIYNDMEQTERRYLLIKEWIDLLEEIKPEEINAEAIVKKYQENPERFNNLFGQPNETTIENIKDFINKAKAIKTDYFEAKAYSELPLNSFSHAIVSDKFPNELVEKLEEQGITVIKFDSEYGDLRPDFVQGIADRVADIDMFDNYNGDGLFGNSRADRGENIKERRNLAELLHRKTHLQLSIENAKTMGINNLMPNTNKTYGEAMLEAMEELKQVQKSIDKIEKKLKAKIPKNQTDLFGGTPDEETKSIANKPQTNPKKAIDDELRLFEEQFQLNFDNPEKAEKLKNKIEALKRIRNDVENIKAKDVETLKISENNIYEKLKNHFEEFVQPPKTIEELIDKLAKFEKNKSEFLDSIKDEPYIKANPNALDNISEQYDNLLKQLYNIMSFGINASELNYIELRNYRLINSGKIDIDKLKKAGLLDTTNKIQLKAIEPIKTYEDLKNYTPKDAHRFMPLIADTFDFLNDEAVEHTYFFVTLKGGREPLIFYSATGSNQESIVNIKEYLPILKDLADKGILGDIYMIHNHPSGYLTPSTADRATREKIRDYVKNISKNSKVHAIIIDKKRGLYTYFGEEFDRIAEKYDVSDISQLPTKFLPKSYKIKHARFLDKPFIAGKLNEDNFSPSEIASYMYKYHYSQGEKTYLLTLDIRGSITRIMPINLDYLLDLKNYTGEGRNSKFNRLSLIYNYLRLRTAGSYSILVTMNPSGNILESSLADSAFKTNTELLDHIFILRGIGEKMQGFTVKGKYNFAIDEILSVYKPYEDLVRDTGGNYIYFGDTYKNNDGNIVRDSIGDYNKFEKAMEELEKQMPNKLSPEEEARLKYLSKLFELTNEERTELETLRKKKRELLKNDPLMRKRLSTWTKDKIRFYKKGYKDGQIDFASAMRKIEQDIVNYAREVLPKFMFRKSEVVNILVKMKEARDIESLEKAFNKIDVIVERVVSREIVAKLNKILRGVNKDSSKKGIPNSVINIAKAKTNKEKLEALIQKLGAIENQRELFEDEQMELYFATKLLNFDTMSTENRAKFVKELDDYVKGNKTKFKEFLEAEKKRKEELRKKAIGVITGWKGVMEEDVARLKKLNEGKPKFLIHKALQYDNMMHSFEWLMDALSKFDKTSEHLNSFLNTYFSDKLQEASINKNFSIKQYKELIRKGLEESFGLKGKELYDLLDELSEVKQTGVFVRKPKADNPNEFEEVELVMSQNEIAKMLLEYEDPTLLPTFEAMHIEADTIKALRRYIDPRLHNWIKWQRNFYNEYYLTINEVYNKVRGYDLPYNPYYSPIERDVQPTQLEQEFLGDNYEFVSIYNGHLKPRVSNKQPLKRQDINLALLQHLVEMEHFKHYAEIINDLRAVFNSKEVRKAIIQYHDPFLLKIINKAINDFARGGQDHKAVYTFVDTLRGNFAKAKIGLNPVVMIKQLTSFPAYMMEIPVKDFFIGLADFMTNPVGKAKFLYKNSKYLQTRYTKGWEREVVLALSRAKQTFKKQISGNMSFTDFIMFMTKIGDGGAIIFGGWGTYKYWLKYYTSKGLNQAEAHKRAIFEFEKATKRSQQSGEIEDLGEMQRGGSWATLWTLFKTAPKSYYSSTSGALRNLYFGRGNKSKLFKRLLIAHFVLPTLFQFASDGFQVNWKKLLRAAIIGSFNGIFILGDVLEIAAKELFQERTWEYEGNPIESIAKETINATKQISKTINREEITIDDFFETVHILSIAIGSFTGVPYYPLYRVVSGTQRAIENPESINPLEAIGFSPKSLEQEEEKELPAKVKLINEKQQRLNKLKKEARETLNKEVINKAKELKKEIEELKKSQEWQDYLEQKAKEREQDIFYEQNKKPKNLNFRNNFMPQFK